MSSKTKIVVLHVKELLYTGIFLILGILFVALLVIMFLPGGRSDKKSAQAEILYVPGIYTTSIQLGGNTVDIEVVVDEDRIHSINLHTLDEAVTAMYPLIEPSFETIAGQIENGQTLEGITYLNENRYTSMLLIDAIAKTLEKAAVSDTDE